MYFLQAESIRATDVQDQGFIYHVELRRSDRNERATVHRVVVKRSGSDEINALRKKYPTRASGLCTEAVQELLQLK